jgi:hypothetical protein
MPRKTWTLTDVVEDIYLDQIALGPDQVGGAAKGYSVAKRTLRGGLRDGVDVVEVNNGRLRFIAVPTRGMGLWKASCDGVQLGWLSPVKGPVHPNRVHLWEGTGIGWLDGFDELLVRCGLENNGSPEFGSTGALVLPLHGKIGNTPAHKVQVSIDGDTGDIAVMGVVDEARLYGNKLRLTTTIATKVGQPWIAVTDEVTNISAKTGELELLYHINFGLPLVTEGAKLSLPIRKMTPRDAAAAADVQKWDTYGPAGSAMELCYFFDLLADSAGATRALLSNAAGNQGVSLKFNKQELPCFTLWKNPQAAVDGYVTGLEPGVNYPNPKSFEKQKGRVVQLSPGETRRFEVTIEAHPDAASVAEVQKAIASIQGSTAPEISPKPDPNWAA